MENSRTYKTFINTAMGIANRFCNIILSFVLRTTFIFILGVQYTGVSSVFTDILTMLSLSELGIGTAIATALYKPLRDNDQIQIRKLMSFYRIAYRCIAVFVTLVGIVLLPFLDLIIKNVPDISENIRLIFIFYIIKTSASYLLIYKTTLLNADQKQYIVTRMEMFCNVVRYLVEVVSLIIFRQYILYLIIEVLATILQNVIVTHEADRLYPYAFKKSEEKLDRTELKKIFKDIKGLAMYQISSSVGNSVDNILVSSYIGTVSVGILSNYTLIRKQVEAVLRQFFSAVTPSVGNLVAGNNVKKQLTIFRRLYYLSFLTVNFCSTSLFVLFNPFIKIWLGEEYLLGLNISFIIAFDMFLYILLQAVASFRTANGLFVKGQYRPLIMAILNVFLSIILIRKYGIFGTILATSICRLLTQWYDPFLLCKYVFHEPFYRYYLTYIKYIFLFLSGSFLTNWIASTSKIQAPMLLLLYRAVCCVIIPNVWAVLFTFKSNEFNYVFDMVTKRLRHIF